MRYSLVPSDPMLVNFGLPWSVALIEPRHIIAAFQDEAAAVMHCRSLNGLHDTKEAMKPAETVKPTDGLKGREEPKSTDLTLSQKLAAAQSASVAQPIQERK